MSLALLNLLHLSDSGFPVGAASFSHGLEGLVQQGALTGAADVEALLRAVLHQGLARCELVALHAACAYAARSDHDALLALDTQLAAMTPVAEWRIASGRLARRTLTTAALLTTSPAMDAYAAQIADGGGTATGHHALAFAVVADALGVGPREAALAYTYSETMARLSAATRLLALGQNATQAIAHRLKPAMQQAVDHAPTVPLERMGSCLPALEIAGMAHEYASARLFAS